MAVSPTAELPLPEVYWDLGIRWYTYWSSWDLLVPGSPHRRMFSSDLNCPRPVLEKSFLDIFILINAGSDGSGKPLVDVGLLAQPVEHSDPLLVEDLVSVQSVESV